MKQKFSGFIAGVLTAAFICSLGITALAASGQLTIAVNPINIQVNGTTFQPKDVKGNNVPVFSYNGTSYAPLRALANAYGLEVGYNSKENMATVNDTFTKMNFSLPSHPYILGIKNITNKLTLIHESDISMPSFKIYAYYYSYKAPSHDEAKELSLKYSNYLQRHGYELTYTGPAKGFATNMDLTQYDLLTPDKTRVVSINQQYTLYTGERIDYIDISIKPNSTFNAITKYYLLYSTVPDFGEYANISCKSISNNDTSTLYAYSGADILAQHNNNLFSEYHNLLIRCGFKYIGTFDGPKGEVMNFKKGNVTVSTGLMSDSTFSVMIARDEI